MEIFIAIGIGIGGGLIGFIPFLVARSRVKANLKKDGMGSILTGMIAVFASFIIMAGELFLAFLFAREHLLPFAMSAIAIFLLAISVYTATLMRR